MKIFSYSGFAIPSHRSFPVIEFSASKYDQLCIRNFSQNLFPRLCQHMKSFIFIKSAEIYDIMASILHVPYWLDVKHIKNKSRLQNNVIRNILVVFFSSYKNYAFYIRILSQDFQLIVVKKSVRPKLRNLCNFLLSSYTSCLSLLQKKQEHHTDRILLVVK